MSKALKPVSATKTAETQLEDLMQALPEHRLEDLSLQTQAVDMADEAAPATEAKTEAKVEQSQKRDAMYVYPGLRSGIFKGIKPQCNQTGRPLSDARASPKTPIPQRTHSVCSCG